MHLYERADAVRLTRIATVLAMLAYLLVVLTATPPAARAAEAALVDCEGADSVLGRNDDSSTSAVPLPFSPNFFGTAYSHLFVNNNGNVTFNQRLSQYTPFSINASTPPIIAAFLADVDTRHPASGVVHYGNTSYAGRTAFCVNYRDVGGSGVGYFSGHADKLNSFQILLVDRSDLGPGDFDIVLNYGSIQWETGDASGGSGGFGGISAGAGFSAGDGDPSHFFELPGSRVNGALLDSNASGLANTTRNSLVNGRHVFAVRNGVAPTAGTISGLVSGAGVPLPGAPVQICRISDDRCVFNTVTNADGAYNATGLPAGAYSVRAFPPAGSTLSTATVLPPVLENGQSLTADLVLTGPTAPAPGTSIESVHTSPSGIPSVSYAAPLTLTTTGCPSGSATYSVTLADGTIVHAGLPMSEQAPGNYVAEMPPLGNPGETANVSITLSCPDPGDDATMTFTVYIDPSGFVRTVGGVPLPGATVTLYRSDDVNGPFVQVPDGSAIMSPANRVNPDLTNAVGHFGWDVITGWYKVRAEKSGCTAPGNPGQAFVETGAMFIPPPVLDLDLRLQCTASNQAPTVNAGPDRGVLVGRPVLLDATVTDPDSSETVQWSLDPGAPCSLATAGAVDTNITCSAPGTYTARLTVSDGVNEPVVDTVTVTVSAALCGSRVPTILGTAGADALKGTAGNDVIAGLGGDDRLYGLGGNDIICGDQGKDTLSGGDGTDVLFGGDDADIVHGGVGLDNLRGDFGDDSLFGGADADLVHGNAGQDRVVGEDGDDLLHGDGGHDYVAGFAGDDTLHGAAGNDYLVGGLGANRLYGDANDDRLDGGAGTPGQCDGGTGVNQLVRCLPFS